GGELAALDSLAVVRERPADRGKRDLRPGNIVPREQPHLGALRPGRDVGRGQARAVDDLHLREARDGVDGEHALDLDLGARLLPGLAQRTVGRGLVQLEVAGRQGPEAPARIDVAPAQQDAVLPAADRADDDFRILVLDESAIAAHQPLAVVAFRHAAHEASGQGFVAHGARVAQARARDKPGRAIVGTLDAHPHYVTTTSRPTVMVSVLFSVANTSSKPLAALPPASTRTSTLAPLSTTLT